MFAAKNELFTRPSGGYVIPRSLRFRASASAYLNRTQGTPTLQAKWTWSGWFKRGLLGGGATYALAGTGTGASDTARFDIGFTVATPDTLVLQGGTTVFRRSTMVLRDPSAWYHLVISCDTTQGTEANKLLAWINGVAVAWGTTNAITTCGFNTATASTLGGANAANFWDGYLAEVNFIDGQYSATAPTSFGAINATTGVWAPIKYTGTYGANGFHLDFNSYATTAALGTDTSGNSNTWTVNNISVTAGVTYDSMIDVPTVSAAGSNYCTLNPLESGTLAATTYSNGNLQATGPTDLGMGGMSMPPNGKYYFEVQGTTSLNGVVLGIVPDTLHIQNAVWAGANGAVGYYGGSGNKYVNSATGAAYGAAFTTGDVIGVAVDTVNNQVTFYKNNVSQGAISLPNPTGVSWKSSASVGGGTPVIQWNFGQQGFTYTPPTGYSALNTYNLPAPSILIGAAHMAATTYTGTGASLTIANTVNSSSFQPDFVWIKSRSAAGSHSLYDVNRGVRDGLFTNVSSAENTEAAGYSMTAFNSNGFTVGLENAGSGSVNANGTTYVGWQWKGSGTTVSNTTGSITSTVCVNPTAGFSVVSYTGTGANATVGHGLGIAPSMVIVKKRSAAASWAVWHSSLTLGQNIFLDSTSAAYSEPTMWNSTAPTSTVFSLGTYGSGNTSSATYVAYCFAPIAGYSAFGSYTGNGSADGPFIYCGFRPRWVMLKNSSAATQWFLYDTTRNTYNVVGYELYANLANAEDTTGVDLDILSSGFKIRSSSTNNGSTNTMIYAAFAESPFKNSLAR